MIDETLKRYKVIGEIFPTDENGVAQEMALEIDSIQEVPVAVGSDWVQKGLAEEVTE